MTQPSASEGTEVRTAKITERHPAYEGKASGAEFVLTAASETTTRVPQTVQSTGKGDLQAALGNDCADQTWPRIDASCLSTEGGTRLVSTIRTVSVSDNLMENTSVVSRVEPTVTAAR